MGKVLTWIAGFFKDTPQSPSSTRLIMIAVTLTVLAVWVVITIIKGELQAIPESVLFFIGMALGIKGLHKGFETRAQVAAIEKDKPAPADVTNVGAAVSVEAAQG